MTSPLPPDDLLLRLAVAAARGSEAAFAELTQRLWPSLSAQLVVHTGDAPLARDLAVTVLASVMDHLGEVESGAGVRALVAHASWRALDDAGLTGGGRPGVLSSIRDAWDLDPGGIARVLGTSVESGELVAARLPAGAPPATIGAQPVPGLEDVLARVRGRWPDRAFSAPPPSAAPPKLTRRRVAWFAIPVALLAGLLAGVLLIPASPVAVTRQRAAGEDPAPPLPTPIPTATPTPRPPTPAPTATPTRTPGAIGLTPPGSPTATRTPTPRTSTTPASTQSPTPTTSATASATPTQTPTATPQTATSTPTSCVASLSVQVNTLTIEPERPISFTLFNSFCSQVTFSVESDAAWLNVTPPGGSLGPGQQASISALATPPGEAGTYRATITIRGGVAPIVISVSSTRP